MAESIIFPELTRQEEGHAVVTTQNNENMRKPAAGDKVYLVPATWMARWMNFVGYTYDPLAKKLVPSQPSKNTPPPPNPGPIDSRELLEQDPNPGDLTADELASTTPLRPGLVDKQDYWCLHEATFNLLKERHGVVHPEIYLEYMLIGPSKRPDIHINRWSIKAIDEHSRRSVVVTTYPMATPLSLKEACCAALDVDVDEHVLMSFAGQQGEPLLLEIQGKTLFGLNIQDRQAVLLRRRDHPSQQTMLTTSIPAVLLQQQQQQHHQQQQQQESDPTVDTYAKTPLHDDSLANHITSTHQNLPSLPPLITTTTPAVAMSVDPAAKSMHAHPVSPSSGSLSPQFHYSTAATSPSFLSSSPLSRSFGRAPTWAEDMVYTSLGRRAGLAGFANLGNTCFMNSSLQCLSHTPPLIQTFLRGSYKKDLNKENPLGLGGKLASAYGGLMSKLWRGGVSHVSPKHFKWQLGKFAPQFGGYAQQDSQELLSFLLDGLHEDLNRIMVKPYKEEKDSNGRSDAEIAAEAWENYRARNNSVIVDHFQGLYKSTLRCPQCNHQSIKFDPFMYLSLPLPMQRSRMFTVTVIHADGQCAPSKIAVEAAKSATIGTLIGKIASTIQDDPSMQRLVEVDKDSTIGAINCKRQEWVLMQWDPSAPSSSPLGKVKIFQDMNASINEIKEKKAGFSFSLSSSSSSVPHLYAYRYPYHHALSPIGSTSTCEAQQDPQMQAARAVQQFSPRPGTRPVVVFHKHSYAMVAPPAILFVSPPQSSDADATTAQPESDMATQADAPTEDALPHQGAEKSAIGYIDITFEPATRSGYWHVKDPPQDLILSIDTMLLPFRKHSVDRSKEQSNNNNDNGDDDDDGGPVGKKRKEETPSFTEDMETSNHINHPHVNDSHAAATTTEVMDVDDARENSENEHVDHTMCMDGPGVDGMSGHHSESAAIVAATIAEYTLLHADASGQAAYYYGKDPPSIHGWIAAKKGTKASAGREGANSSCVSEVEPVYLSADWDSIPLQSLDQTPWKHPVEHVSATRASAVSKASPPGVSLMDCVDAFCQPEQLDASDSWYCSTCKAHVQADKKLDLWSLPEVLVVHLKRFSYSRYSRDKLDTRVDFPLEGLDLRSYVPYQEGGMPISCPEATNNHAPTATPTAATPVSIKTTAGISPPRPPAPLYDLFAVSNHYGGLGGGHYTAFCKMPDDNKWYTFDDNSVNGMSDADVVTSAAYVLFYRRRGATDDGLEDAIKATADGVEAEGDEGGERTTFSPRSARWKKSLGGTTLAQVAEDVDEIVEKDGIDAPMQGEMDDGGGGDAEGGKSKNDAFVAHALPLDEDDLDDFNMEGVA